MTKRISTFSDPNYIKEFSELPFLMQLLQAEPVEGIHPPSERYYVNPSVTLDDVGVQCNMSLGSIESWPVILGTETKTTF